MKNHCYEGGVAFLREGLRVGNEENVSAQPKTTQSNPRVSGEDAEQGRSSGDFPASAQGSASPGGVISWKRGFERCERLRRKKEFARVYEKGRRVPGKYFIAYVLVRGEGPLRLGVVASRKVGKAVARNRAKRLLREVFRKNRPDRPVPADVVLIARSAMTRATYLDVEKAYVHIVRRAIEEAGQSTR